MSAEALSGLMAACVSVSSKGLIYYFRWAVQWLRCCASTSGVTSSIPGQETKIPHSVQPKEKKTLVDSVTIGGSELGRSAWEF